MPEGDTIHKLAAALQPELQGGVLTMKFAQHHRSLALGEGWGEGTIRSEATFHHPGWLDSPHDR